MSILPALLLTACYGSAPTAVDINGEVDLAFDTTKTLGLSLAGRQVIEVKSVPGTFRTFDAAINRAARTGIEPQREHSITAESARDVVAGMASLVEAAAAKTATADADGRHAFVVVHPFERFALEVFDELPLIASVLPDIHLPEGLDVLWVLWYPFQLTAWARRLGAWTQVFFDAVNEDEAEIDDVLMSAEADLLSRLGPSDASPFQFVVRSVTTDE